MNHLNNINSVNHIQSLLQMAAAKGLSRLDAEVLLAHVLSESRVYLYSWPEKSVSEKDIIQFNSFIMRRLAGEPIAYLVGKKEFWSLMLDVKPGVLIPRPETELLVELALKLLPEEQEIQLLELGTGSGAISLALAFERPHWTLFATDISVESIAVAKENARKLSLNNIHFYLMDWFKALHSKPLFHAIISNPPYIAENDSHLSSTELSFEPIQALKSGVDGLLDLQKIIADSENYLLSKAWLLVEHGFNQSSSVSAFFKAKHFINVKTYKDLAAVNRVTVGQKA